MENQSIGNAEFFTIEHCDIQTNRNNGKWQLAISFDIDSSDKATTNLKLSILDIDFEKNLDLEKGMKKYTFQFDICEDKINLWWPKGYGRQHLYTLSAVLGNTHIEKLVAFRTIELEEAGDKCRILINGRNFKIKGIRCNSLPNSKIGLMALESAAIANINTIKISGNTQIDDSFYRECDRFGLCAWREISSKCDKDHTALLESDDSFLYCADSKVELKKISLYNEPSFTSGTSDDEFSDDINVPRDKKKLLYLSQIYQAWRIASSIMIQRAKDTHPNGIMISSLDSTSNSALDERGSWNALMYSIRRIYSPIAPLLFIENDSLMIYGVNDTDRDEDIELKIKFRFFNGSKKESLVYNAKLPASSSTLIQKIPLKGFNSTNIFAYAKMQNKTISMERTILLSGAKEIQIENPELKIDISKLSARKASIKISSIHPAFGVMLDPGAIEGYFSDNLLSVRPTAEKNIIFTTNDDVDLDTLYKEISAIDLYSALY